MAATVRERGDGGTEGGRVGLVSLSLERYEDERREREERAV